MFLNFFDFGPRIILKLFLNNKGVALTKTFREYIPTFFDVLLHYKTKKEFIFCINSAKAQLKAVL